MGANAIKHRASLILATALAFSLALLLSSGFSPFPSENEYVWCFAKRTLPDRLGSDISGAKITSLQTFPAREIRADCLTGVPHESFSECRRLSFHLADLRADWENALAYSNPRDIWTGFSSINNAEAAVLKYSQALSSAKNLEDAILSEIESESLKKISGLVGESENKETFLSIHSALSLSRTAGEIERDSSDVRLFHSQILAYYSHFREFSEDLQSSHIFKTNCSALSNWSLFECSSPGWALVNIACAGNLASCVLATDCEATVANNVTKLRAYLPDFRYFWDKNRGERISSAIGSYSEYSELYLKAEKIYAEKSEDAFLLSRQVQNLLSEARAERLGEIPAPLQFRISRATGESLASFYETGNISESVIFSERALERFSGNSSALFGKSLGERLLAIEGLRIELSNAKGALESAFKKSALIEKELDSILSENGFEDRLESFLYLPTGRRIVAKQAIYEGSEKELARLFEVACAPRGTKFPDLSLGGLEREGEGLSPEKCKNAPTNDAILLALSEEYETRVNGLRWKARLLSEGDWEKLEHLGKYEFMASGGWISAKNAWGFLSALEREYSQAISDSGRPGEFSFSEKLIIPIVSNKVSYSRIYGDALPPDFSGPSGRIVSKKTFVSQFSSQPNLAPAPLREIWTVGGCRISPSPAGAKAIDFFSECETPFDSSSFLFERNLGVFAESAETYSSEEATSREYSATRKYSLSCREDAPAGEIAIDTGIILPEDRVSSRGAEIFSDKGRVFAIANCSASGKTIETKITYSNPVEVFLSFRAPGKATVTARNLLGISLKKARIFFTLPKNSSFVFIGGAEGYPSEEGAVFYETDLFPGETRQAEVSFSSSSGYSPPKCPFCCGIDARFPSLTEEKRAEAVEFLPRAVELYSRLSSSINREKVSKLACADSFREALLLSEELAISEKASFEKSACLEISASAVSDRRAISALKARTERVRTLRKKFPFGNFEDAPDLSIASLLVSEAERDCNKTKISEAEAEIERSSTKADLSIESAAIWSYSEFSENELGPEVTGEIISAVESRVGNRTRILFSGRRLELPEAPLPSEYGIIIDSVVAASGEIAPTSELARRAQEAVSKAEGLSDKSAAGVIYLEKANSALAENRLLDGYFLGHYSAILSEKDGLAGNDSGAKALKIGVAIFSIALAAGIILAGNARKRNKSKGKANGKANGKAKGTANSDSLFGEIR